jgi:dihydrofolate reductase
MRRLSVFNNVSLDGYFVDATGDMSWAHQQSDDEWDEFTTNNASGGGELLFGRVTYQMMESFWPTAQGHESNPVVAEQMNDLPKVVYSRTLDDVSWQNTTLVRDHLEDDVRERKNAEGPGLILMGSGTIVSQLAAAGLVDQFQLAFVPIVLGAGRTLFEGVSERFMLHRTDERTFGNGTVVITYEPTR